MPDNDTRDQATELLASAEYSRLTGLANSPDGPWSIAPENIRANWRQSFIRCGEILAEAGWTPPARVIETIEELDALPVGAVIRYWDSPHAEPGVWQRADCPAHESPWWICTGVETPFDTAEIPLPVTVLWMPEASADA